jgi:serine/threonine protein kinase
MKYCESCHSTYPTTFTICPKDHNRLRFALELSEGMVLRGKYEILEKIGAGGMAVVYRVRHLHLQEDVAIKVICSRLAEDQGFVDRFRTEAVITRKLRHPNAVRIDDFDTTEDGQPFIVMEYVRGESLRKVLQNHGPLPPDHAADIARQAALALGAAHELGIVHRDIKPENILLLPQADGCDLVKVLDFGIAKVNEGSFDVGPGHEPTRTGLVLGTPKYLSPEQVKGGTTVDGRADLYALGVVLYEMLTGQPPFSGDAPFTVLLQHLQSPPTPPCAVNPAISSAMSRLVLKALEKDPAQRFCTGQEMADAIINPEILAPADSRAHFSDPTVLATASVATQDRGWGNVATSRTLLSRQALPRPPLFEAASHLAQRLVPRLIRKRTFVALAAVAAIVVLVTLTWVSRGDPAAGSTAVSNATVQKVIPCRLARRPLPDELPLCPRRLATRQAQPNNTPGHKPWWLRAIAGCSSTILERPTTPLKRPWPSIPTIPLRSTAYAPPRPQKPCKELPECSAARRFSSPGADLASGLASDHLLHGFDEISGGQQRITALGHGRCAGVISESPNLDVVLVDADDALNDADRGCLHCRDCHLVRCVAQGKQ